MHDYTPNKFRLTAIDFIVLSAALLTLISYLLTDPSEYEELDFAIGIVWSFVIGMGMGSYATAFVARIPKGIFAKVAKPYCASCKRPILIRDLYPVYSYIRNRGKCRFCESSIPVALFYTETLVIIFSVLSYIAYGFGMKYNFAFLGATCLIIMLAMWLDSRYYSRALAILTIALGIAWIFA